MNTDLSEPFQGNVRPEKLFPVDTAAVQLLDVSVEYTVVSSGLVSEARVLLKQVLDSLDISDSGKFFDYAREPIEW